MLKGSSPRRWMPWLMAIATLGAAGAAHAGGVHWSIGINLPGPPVVYGPPPAVVYAPPPVVYEPRPVRYYSPPPVVYYEPVVREEWCPPRYHGYRHGRWEGRRGWDRDRY